MKPRAQLASIFEIKGGTFVTVAHNCEAESSVFTSFHKCTRPLSHCAGFASAVLSNAPNVSAFQPRTRACIPEIYPVCATIFIFRQRDEDSDGAAHFVAFRHHVDSANGN